MKTFARHKTFDEIAAQCADQGLRLHDGAYAAGTSDYIVVWRHTKRIEGAYPHNGRVLYSPVHGRFLGRTDTGIEFTEASASLEGTDWYDAILAFFYVEKA